MPFVVKEEKMVEKENEGDKGEMSLDDGDKNEEKEGETFPGDGDGEKESSSLAPAEKLALPAQVEKKQVFNLNNEVVNMRKEVKRVRSLIIRKLTRQIEDLKKKKGKEEEVEKNQRRATRLLKEVHSMKKLRPDQVTKTALRRTLNFEKVCKNHRSTMSDRALARIATHRQFDEKIQNLKAAVAAFKEERSKAGKQEAAAKVQRQPEKATLSSPDTKVERKSEEILDAEAVEPQEGTDSEKGVGVLETAEDGAAANTGMETEKLAQKKTKSTVVKSTPVKNTQEKGQVKPNPPSKLEENNLKLQPVFAVLDVKTDEGSDVELSDNEAKEYFDDSTEERFNKQSSQSEESDDDFFVGKVSKFKKKKKKQEGVKEEKAYKAQQEKSVDPGGACNKLQQELDELEARLKPKVTSFQSVFCQSLARTKTGRGFDRRKGGAEIQDQEKLRTANRFRDDLDRQFNKGQEKTTSYSKSKFSEPWSGGRHPEVQKMGGRGGGRSRGDARMGKDHRGRGGSSHQPLLHPSWEASKKRKEQQGQILAFQGKKIKFDDDDD
ncbi:serum response factor-binding protein 1 [Austrofundulus limnaeus]|uniref:Serum response factor-binding protein 1 n=1 Tax=Austrofundulus limnaeus TaxID=52670 RepID=A0A2I4CAX6_AUSLI|nr:PREDICTED: serum response factor-binding protein 1 [Austrofundulus limnaeus]